MPQGSSRARDSLARALSTTTIHRRLLLPEDLADHLLAPDDEVLLALPGIPDETPRILLVTREEVILGRWSAEGTVPKDVTRKRAVPAHAVRGASYTPGMYYDVEISVDSARDLKIARRTGARRTCERRCSTRASSRTRRGSRCMTALP